MKHSDVSIINSRRNEKQAASNVVCTKLLGLTLPSLQAPVTCRPADHGEICMLVMNLKVIKRLRILVFLNVSFFFSSAVSMISRKLINTEADPCKNQFYSTERQWPT